ncbi:MAG: hypothetical protein RL359_1160 [Actinomycetota bacterium]|jgi:phosphate transport system protein
MTLIRSVFQDELDHVSSTLTQMSEMVTTSIEKASVAIQSRDLALAESVIAADEVLDTIQHELDARIIDIIARQQPVASDLRALVTALRMSADLERMGDLAHHVSKVVRLRHPESAIPDELAPLFKRIGDAAVKMSKKTEEIIQTRNTKMAIMLEREDDEMDNLHRELITTLAGLNWSHGVETAIDLTLLGRYYERFADHAVSVSRRVYFLVTGTYY